MGTGLLILFYTMIGCIIALLTGRLLRQRLFFGLLAGIAAVLLAERLLIQTVSFDDAFFWEAQARLAAFAFIPVALVAWLGSGIRRSTKSRD